VFQFNVVTGTIAREIISKQRPAIVDEVRRAYLAHGRGLSVNPDSYFLRFPAKPDSRIIALPAYLGGEYDVAGIKWIGSFPANIDSGMPRASAVLLLNDCATGYPFACLEASQISAARTAASAVLAAEVLTRGTVARKLAIFGAGIIARNILEFFRAQNWAIENVVVHDRVEKYGRTLAGHTEYIATFESEPAAALDGADLVVLATTAAEPYLLDPATFKPGQTVLNISLRDLGPEIIFGAYNVLDDVEHCLKANTSPHLAEQQYGHRNFISGTLAQVIEGAAAVGHDKPIIFSPFGLGVLDLAVGTFVHQAALAEGAIVSIPEFFGETRRW
jgi:ornithine cyclodeaminase